MGYPAITSIYAAILGLIYAVLSAWVIAGRRQFKANLGDGGHAPMLVRTRIHANFVEYVPFILLLTALLEARGATPFTVHALLGALLVARIAHPIGMVARPASLQQFAFRGAGAFVTLMILAVAAVLLLIGAPRQA